MELYYDVHTTVNTATYQKCFLKNKLLTYLLTPGLFNLRILKTTEYKATTIYTLSDIAIRIFPAVSESSNIICPPLPGVYAATQLQSGSETRCP